MNVVIRELFSIRHKSKSVCEEEAPGDSNECVSGNVCRSSENNTTHLLVAFGMKCE
jgi:hypothetical protein